MKSIQRPFFTDTLDIVQTISKPAREMMGEDSFYCAKSDSSALVSVYDGCGGLGARRYESFQGHTGAYIASRTVSGAIHDWYHDNHMKSWKNSKQLVDSINGYIRKAYALCEQYSIERLKIRGSMVRKFPTTMALAYAENDSSNILLHVLWAGDSRVYLLDEDGLAQLTLDDTDVKDALDNLTSDGTMTNVISSDGDYSINYKSLIINKPTVILAATDGCFGYVTSPMEFEYLFLKALEDGSNPKDFRRELKLKLTQYAGDDLAMGIMTFYFGDFNNTKKVLVDRLRFLEETYIRSIMTKGCSEEDLYQLWKSYKPMYERFLR